jgi:general secretion pathway protein G
MMLRFNARVSRGFTLIELLIVMAILGMLAAIVGPTVLNRFGESQVSASRNQLKAFETALDTHRLDTGKYPNGLDGLLRNTTNNPRWRGPYIKSSELPKDPWGNDYRYRLTGQTYQVCSLGANGSEGGEGDDADICL